MIPLKTAPATLESLYREPGKAELIGGRVVRIMVTGFKPNRVAFRIAQSLDSYATQKGKGVVCTDNIGFAVRELSSGRQSFSPDASYYVGPLPRNPMRFIEGPPTLAVEVQSEGDFGAQAERELASKRADYFEAGTQVVWDVDPVAECIHVYRAAEAHALSIFRRGQEAEAEPAAPGWRVSVDWIFVG